MSTMGITVYDEQRRREERYQDYMERDGDEWKRTRVALAEIGPSATDEQMDAAHSLSYPDAYSGPLAVKAGPRCVCSICGESHHALARLGYDPPDWEIPTLDVCATCLNSALEVIKYCIPQEPKP